MTAVLTRPTDDGAAWASMPGWNVVADLTPPELIAARGLRKLRRLLAIALLFVVAACVGGYAYAVLQSSSAQDSVDSSNSESTQLIAAGAKYADVTRIKAAIDAASGQVATLMSGDVDTARLLADVRHALPGSMSVSSISLTITPAVDGAATTPSLDMSGDAVIGTITIAGTARSLDDLGRYVAALSALKGVINVVPTSNTSSTAHTAAWNLTAQLTTQRLSHQYQATTDGS